MIVGGDQLAADLAADRPRPSNEVGNRPPSTVGLLVARLRLVGQVLYGDADPAVLITPRNQVSASIVPSDALLRPWSEAKRRTVAESEAERLRQRLAGGGRRH